MFECDRESIVFVIMTGCGLLIRLIVFVLRVGSCLTSTSSSCLATVIAIVINTALPV